jgi:hypothetical protein
MSEEIEIARQWLAKARNDLLNADNNLKSEQIPFDTVCLGDPDIESYPEIKVANQNDWISGSNQSYGFLFIKSQSEAISPFDIRYS